MKIKSRKHKQSAHISTVLITGCTRGLGRELAKNLTLEDYQIYAVGRTEEDLLLR